MTGFVTFDLETIPSLDPAVRQRIEESIQPPGNISKQETIDAWNRDKRPAAVEEAWRKTAFDGGLGKIAVISWAIEDQDPVFLYSNDWETAHGERQVIESFFGDIGRWLTARRGDSTRPLIVGHNCINFDLRFLYRRCVVLRVPVPYWLPVNARPWDDHVFDTMVAWAGHRDYASMDSICEALGIEGKGEMDGSKVWDAVKEGRISEVAQYCAEDVSRTREMYKRMSFQEA